MHNRHLCSYNRFFGQGRISSDRGSPESLPAYYFLEIHLWPPESVWVVLYRHKQGILWDGDFSRTWPNFLGQAFQRHTFEPIPLLWDPRGPWDTLCGHHAGFGTLLEPPPFSLNFHLSRTLADLEYPKVFVGHTSVIFLDSRAGAMIYNRMEKIKKIEVLFFWLVREKWDIFLLQTRIPIFLGHPR